MKQNRKLFNFVILFIIISFIIGIFASGTSSFAASPVFSKKYKTLTVGKSVQYKIKHLKKNYSVTFSVSKSSFASIQSKTGKLLAKKAGKLTVKATIYNKKHKKVCQLKDVITIKKKNNLLPNDSAEKDNNSLPDDPTETDNSSLPNDPAEKEDNYLPNASFQIKESINPWDFTLNLSCSRILLKSEIKDSSLIMLSEDKTDFQLKADFLKLSSDGKKITYLFNKDSQKKLCPGDFSMDGKYTIQCSHFNQKLSVTYQERLAKNTLAGFVVKQDGNPVKNAMLSLKTSCGTSQYNTDDNGYYSIKNISEPLSLTIFKEGFETVTLNEPPLSAKGVSCENVILRSKKETNLSLEFLITDTDNHPIPNASVTITLDKNSSTIKTENTSISSDFLSRNNVLSTQNTDSSGTLFLSNHNLANHFPAPCSDFEVNQKTRLTYVSTYQPSSNHHVLLSPKKLNTTDQYSIYINGFSSDNYSIPYYPQKISFSFSNLYTDHARFHIQLSECPKLSIQSLSASYEEDISPFSCDTVFLNIFHPEEKNPIYQHEINYHSFQQKENKLFLSSLQLPISLLDGKYYLQIQLFSKEKELICETPISPVTIQNSSLISKELILKSLRFARILTYANLEETTPEMASFQLYQKIDKSYFRIDTFSTDFFTSENHTIFTATLLLSHLIENETYLLTPVKDNIMAKEELAFIATFENTFSTKKEAVYSILPLAQIFCGAENNFLNTDKQEEVTMTYSTFHKITLDFVRSCETYPNCILAFYHPDGTLLTVTLTNKITKKTIPSDFSDNKSSIIDIYTNKEPLITNQNSYLISPL